MLPVPMAMVGTAILVCSPKRQDGLGSSVQTENTATHFSTWAEEEGGERAVCSFEVEVACFYFSSCECDFF